MKNAIFTITFTPVAVAIICSVLITINDYAGLMPVWLLWQAVLFSTMAALIAVCVLVAAGFIQWLVHQVDRPVM